MGVQRGTTYESMVQSLLVDTGLMSADKLLSYMQTDEAVRDLIENRVDVVLLGRGDSQLLRFPAEPASGWKGIRSAKSGSCNAVGNTALESRDRPRDG